MIRYGLVIEKSGKIYCYGSPQFQDLKGYGITEEDAFKDFLKKFHEKLRSIIKKRQSFPSSISGKAVSVSKKGTGSFQLPISIELAMRLHTTMLEKGVDKSALARLLALTDDDVKSGEWNLKKTLKIMPKVPPKYKKVQRLLDISHDSTLDEMSEAFRVLDCLIDVNIVSK